MNTTSQKESVMPRRAYSYSRVSTPGKQVRGDGLARQKEYAEELCEKNGWCLDDTLKFVDAGRSGFHGHNLKPTADLSRFLDLVDRGRITAGSVLIIENIDRLSRQDVDVAYDLFRSIIRAGVWIATRTPERIYKKESNSFMDLMEPIWLMYLGHQESLKKSGRIKHVWQSQRERAREKKAPMQAQTRHWIERTEDGYRLIPEQAAGLRRVCQLLCEGLGVMRACDRATREGHPPPPRTGRWNRDHIHKIVRSRVLVGEFQPHRKIDGKEVPEGPPIPDYYPPVLTEEEWQRLQVAIESRKYKGGRPAKQMTNLFTGLIFDETTGRPMSLKTLSTGPAGADGYKKKYAYLRITKSRNISVPYHEAEACILDTLAMLRPEDVIEPAAKSGKREERIGELTARQTALDVRQRQLQAAAADPEQDAGAILPALARVSKELAAVAKELETLKMESLTGRVEALREAQTLRELRDQVTGQEREELDRRIKAALPTLVTRITMKAERTSWRGRQTTTIKIHLRSGQVREVVLLSGRWAGKRPGKQSPDDASS